MLTVSFSQVLNGIWQRAGLDPADVSDADTLAMIQAIADRYKYAFEYYPWPIFSTTEQRYFRPVWDSGTTYSAGDIIYHAAEADYYTAAASPNTPAAGENPTDNPTTWAQTSDFYRYIDYTQAGETAISAGLHAWSKDPRVYSDALEVSFKVRQEGLAFAPDVGVKSIFLTYRPRPARFAATIYSATATYAVGARVYHAAEGDVYECLVATTAGETPTTTPASWSLVEFPDFLELAVKAGAYADWLTGDERPKAAALAEGKFIELLDEEVWQLTKLQGQTGQLRVTP